MTGAVIAPGATVNINHNLNGTVVADNINVRAESHRTDFVGKITEPEEEPGPAEYHISVRKIETGYAGQRYRARNLIYINGKTTHGQRLIKRH